MKASNEKKLDLAREVLLAYIANSPADNRSVESVVDAAKKIFDAIDGLVESTDQSKEQAGFRL